MEKENSCQRLEEILEQKSQLRFDNCYRRRSLPGRGDNSVSKSNNSLQQIKNVISALSPQNKQILRKQQQSAIASKPKIRSTKQKMTKSQNQSTAVVYCNDLRSQLKRCSVADKAMLVRTLKMLSKKYTTTVQKNTKSNTPKSPKNYDQVSPQSDSLIIKNGNGLTMSQPPPRLRKFKKYMLQSDSCLESRNNMKANFGLQKCMSFDSRQVKKP